MLKLDLNLLLAFVIKHFVCLVFVFLGKLRIKSTLLEWHNLLNFKVWSTFSLSLPVGELKNFPHKTLLRVFLLPSSDESWYRSFELIYFNISKWKNFFRLSHCRIINWGKKFLFFYSKYIWWWNIFRGSFTIVWNFLNNIARKLKFE